MTETRGERPSLHLKLLLALTAAIAAVSLHAVAASPAAAYQTSCTDSSEACDSEDPGDGIQGPSTEGEADTPGDASTKDGAQSDGSSDGSSANVPVPDAGVAVPDAGGTTDSSSSKAAPGDIANPPDPSSLSWKNGGIDAGWKPDPHIQWAAERTFGLDGPVVGCEEALTNLNADRDAAINAEKRLNHPPRAIRTNAGLKAYRRNWQASADEHLGRVLIYRGVYTSNDCDSVLVGRDF